MDFFEFCFSMLLTVLPAILCFFVINYDVHFNERYSEDPSDET